MDEELTQEQTTPSNETQPEESQDDIDMTSDELAAAMGFMTSLGDQQMVGEQETEEEVVEEESAEESEAESTEEEELEEEDPLVEVQNSFTKQIEGLREELKMSHEKEMSEIKKMIKDALE